MYILLRSSLLKVVHFQFHVCGLTRAGWPSFECIVIVDFIAADLIMVVFIWIHCGRLYCGRLHVNVCAQPACKKRARSTLAFGPVALFVSEANCR